MKPRVFAVLVFVRYTHPDFPKPAERILTVRILAASKDAALLGAMNYAETMRPEGIVFDQHTKATAYESGLLFPMTEVDCIGESLKS